ncbi:MAG: AEC family transporter [Gammaproteobacteria bacterium]|nr:AEC family transporter [Gammaproteobacteria bacterium]
MLDTLLQLVPIFVYLAIGILVREQGLADRSHGDFLLRFVFFVTLPLLILTTVSSITFTPERAILPLLNIVVNLLCYGAALLLLKPRQLPAAVAGSVAVGTLIINNAFMFPFVLAIYGEEGFADSILWDFGNAIMTATFTYAVALKHGGMHGNGKVMLMRIVKSPLVWSLTASVVLSLTQTPIPPLAMGVIKPLGQMTAPLILVALGIFTTLKIHQPALAAKIVAIRMVFGLVCGLALATLLGLDGTMFKVVVLCSAAPIGFMALAFSSLAKLDTDLTSSAVSLSILVGIFWVPLLVMIIDAL